MKKNYDFQLSLLSDMRTPAAVFEEVKCNFIFHYPISAFDDVRSTFADFNRLFEGKYPGYRACNTKFHDKVHTTDALLAISRLIDGYNFKHGKLPVELVKTALIATILHDTGYIQQKSDKKGTGAKYTLSHVARSIDFIKKYFKTRGFPRRLALIAGRMVNCTGLSLDFGKARFGSMPERELGFMLGTADLLGQMASRTYLERLIYLYGEFREGNVKGFPSELVLLKKTMKFYDETKKRLKYTLGGVDRYMSCHFRERYGIKDDLYMRAINRQITYLKEILKYEQKSLQKKLRRKIW